MRTTTLTTSGPSRLQLTVSYPNSIAFMYSRQPVILESYTDARALTVAVTLTNSGSGKTHSERRSFYGTRVEFDVSRMMQLLSPDVDELFRRLYYNVGRGLSESFSLSVSYTDTDGISYSILNISDITAMYGALDQGEVYGRHTQRRLWLNMPQTFNLWRDANGEAFFVLEDACVYPNTAGDGPCCECDLVGTLLSLGGDEYLADFIPGRPVRHVGLTWNMRIERGSETPENFMTVTLVPDACSHRDGTYLRWLNRRGEVSYWLFRNSETRVTSTVDGSFGRLSEGDPAEAPYGVFPNERKADYREAREMVLGAVGLSRDEYEELCSLATSPLVEMFMPDNVPGDGIEVDIIYDGGDSLADNGTAIQGASGQDTEIDAGDATTGRRASQPYTWQRVNVASGTYSRSNRRETPSRQDLEFIIELPERNTVKL